MYFAKPKESISSNVVVAQIPNIKEDASNLGLILKYDYNVKYSH
jgi:hypothetical protein